MTRKEYTLIHGCYYRKDCPICKGTGEVYSRRFDPPEQCDCGCGISEEEVKANLQAYREAAEQPQ